MRHLLITTATVALLTSGALAQSAGQSGNATQDRNAPAAAQGGANQQGSSAGVRQVNPAASMRLTFYQVQAADMRASKLLGADVYNLNNEKIGDVEDLIIDNGKNIKAVVVSVGGFLGIGDRNVAVQPGSVVLSEQQDGSARLVVNTTRDDLKNAPAFNFADVDKAGSRVGTSGQAETDAPGAGMNSNTTGSGSMNSNSRPAGTTSQPAR